MIGSSSKIKCREGIWSQRDIPKCGGQYGDTMTVGESKEGMPNGHTY